MTKAKTGKSKKARKDDKQETEVEVDETGTTATAIQVADIVRDDKGWNVKLPAILNKKIVSYAKYAWGAVSKMADRWADIQRIAAQKQIDLEVCKDEFRYHARQVGMNRHQIDYALHAEQRREDARIKRLEHKKEFEDAKKATEQEQETEVERLNVKTPEEEIQNQERDDDVTMAKIEDVITDTDDGDKQDSITTTTAEQQKPKEFTVVWEPDIFIPLIDVVAAAQGIDKIEIKPKARKEFEKSEIVVSIKIDQEANTVEYLGLNMVDKE